MPLEAIKVKSGKVFDIYVLEENGRCELLVFFKSLDSGAWAKLNRRLDWTKDTGLLKNTEYSKYLDWGIHYFRTRDGVRVFYFMDGEKMVICTNGYMKKKDKLDPQEIDRARIWKRKYESEKSANTLEFNDGGI